MTRNTANDDSTGRQIEYLAQFMLPEREATLRQALSERTRYITLCTENTFHPQNASALMRTCEAFGIQDIHTVDALCTFSPNLHIVRGTDKWVDLHRYASTTAMISELRAQGYRIVATSPHTGDYPPETLPIDQGPIALLFGTEHAGLSPEALEAADDYVHIPMCGLVESLNLSASASILLYTLSQRLRASSIAWHLEPQQGNAILLRWMKHTVRDADNILLRGGYPL